MQLLKLPYALVLVLLTLANLLIYLDRGTLGVISTQGLVYRLKSPNTLNLTDTQAGMLGSLFMFGYMIANPLFAYAAQYVHSIKIVASASVLWILATLLAGFSNDFETLVIARILTGVSEASYVSLVPPIIMDISPERVKTVRINQMYLAAFLSAGAVGQALGYIYGEVVYSAFGDWHIPFLLESFAMMPFMIIFFVLDLEKVYIHDQETLVHKLSVFKQIGVLFSNTAYIFILLGMSAQTFTVGAIAFWAPDYLESHYKMEPDTSVLFFGGITIFCSLTGSFLGSALLDSLMRKRLQVFQNPEENETEIDMIRTVESLKILFITGFLSCATGCAAVLCPNQAVFLILMGLTEMLIFIGIGPQGTSIMTSVPHHLRAQSCAVSVFAQHLLGDFPSAYIVGWLSDAINKQFAMFAVAVWLVWAGIFWVLGYIYKKEEHNKYTNKLL